ncbi:phage tail-collar fiber domain-containing protein [Aeromonas veronii]|uniref:phage tail-collar fiber domain-containing protein n=1 Tax=Aeromonas veronii TaxID=654 RepID=UPI001F1872AE|nr:phage tail protein [Aeromonas veronii]MCF5900146.1 phage tail protein [Aeromonas veronii]
MSQIITNAFSRYWQECLTNQTPVVLDEFVLANVPDLDPDAAINPDSGLPPAGQIVHRHGVDQRGRINNDAVAYTIVMDTTVGDFSFNAMYLINKASGVVGMIVHKGLETKLKTDEATGQTGNSLVKSMLMEYDRAAPATATHVDASTWQIDYAARLRGMDNDLRLQALQFFGPATFYGDGFKLINESGVYKVQPGVAYVGGLRAELNEVKKITPGAKPVGLWLDIYRAGSLLDAWVNHFTLTLSVPDMVDYLDSNGYQHHVAKVAIINANGSVTDVRRKRTIELTGDVTGKGILEDAQGVSIVVEVKDGSHRHQWSDLGNVPETATRWPNPDEIGAMRDGGVYSSVTMSNWFRSAGETGWYSADFGGGIYMKDTEWIRVFGGKKLFVENYANDAINTGGGVFAAGEINAHGGIKDKDQRVYSPINKPSPDDIGALNKRLRMNWVDGGVLEAVIGQMAWRNYGDDHTIFDASKGVSPDGAEIGNKNATMPWSETFPTLMGWNGRDTYGVRVDSARIADSVKSNPVPAGVAYDWLGDIAPPGYAILGGQPFNVSTCPQLARLFPSGVLPDLRGHFIRVADAGRGKDPGRAVLTIQAEQIGPHMHTIGFTGNMNYSGGGGNPNSNWGPGSNQRTNNNDGHENRPENIALNKIVELK